MPHVYDLVPEADSNDDDLHDVIIVHGLVPEADINASDLHHPSVHAARIT